MYWESSVKVFWIFLIFTLFLILTVQARLWQNFCWWCLHLFLYFWTEPFNFATISLPLSVPLASNRQINHSCFSVFSFSPCRLPHLDKNRVRLLQTGSRMFPEYQRTASVQWTPYSHWISASLSLFSPMLLFLFSSLPSVTVSPPLRLPSFPCLLLSIIPFSFHSRRPSLHPELSLFISLLPPHINIPQSLLLPVNRVTLQSAVASPPPVSSPSLSLPLSCG